ncbi:MAG TPA: DJ-1/PfpI family protein, partial [Puia sp.]|nr:DJ-1/PfpI family protein [Puia sp.]
MKHLTIVVPDGPNNISSITGSFEILTRANDFWKAGGRMPLYKIEVAGVSTTNEFEDGLFSVRPHLRVSEIKKTDLVIIPSLNHNYQKAMKGNTELADWIAWQYKNGAEIASVCTGAFLLASAGLLDGKSCSTHWSVAENFRVMFPKVNLQTDKLITDEN